MITGPTTFYHRTERPRIVSSDAEYAALGPGWADTPAAFLTPEPEPEPAPVPDAPGALAPVVPLKKRGRPRKEIA